MVAEQLRHLLLAFQVLLSRIPHAGGIVQILARIEADQPVVRLRIVGHDEMGIVRSDIFNVMLGRQLQNHGIDPLLVFVHIRIPPGIAAAVQLHLQVVVVAENLLEFTNHRFGFVKSSVHNRLRQLAAQTGRTADNPLVICTQQLLIHARMVIITFGKGIGNHLCKVVITGQVFRQQDQVMPPVLTSALLVKTASRRHIDLAAENRFDSLFDRRIVKLFYPEHIAVVGNRERRHTQRLGPFDQGFDRRSPVEDRILRMYVKMNKLTHNNKYFLSLQK